MSGDKRPVIYDQNINFFRNLIVQARLVWLLMRDPRVPLWLKALPIGSLIYLISPVDIISDVLPILGQIDDLMIVLGGLTTFISLCPSHVVEEHLQSIRGEGEDWKVKSQSTSDSSVDSDELETTVLEAKYTEPPEEDSKP